MRIQRPVWTKTGRTNGVVWDGARGEKPLTGSVVAVDLLVRNIATHTLDKYSPRGKQLSPDRWPADLPAGFANSSVIDFWTELNLPTFVSYVCVRVSVNFDNFLLALLSCLLCLLFALISNWNFELLIETVPGGCIGCNRFAIQGMALNGRDSGRLGGGLMCDSDIDVDCQGRKRAGFWGNFTMHASELNPTICVEADCMVRKL